MLKKTQERTNKSDRSAASASTRRAELRRVNERAASRIADGRERCRFLHVAWDDNGNDTLMKANEEAQEKEKTSTSACAVAFQISFNGLRYHCQLDDELTAWKP